jgi:YVTN family beta-propeller protein
VGAPLDDAGDVFVSFGSSVSGSVADDSEGGTGTTSDALPTITIESAVVTEGHSGTVGAVFTVTLSSASPTAVTVDFATAQGTALPGLDYMETAGTLTFAPGETSKSIVVLVTGDTLAEAAESFVIDLTNPRNGTIDGGHAEGTILDDDPVVNTPAGRNVVVAPVDATTETAPVVVTFANVTQAGNTALATSAGGPAPPPGFGEGTPGVYYDLTTTALFDGTVTVCIDYSGIAFADGARLRLFHADGASWEDVTVSLSQAEATICASTTSLSAFGIFEPATGPVVAVTNWGDSTVSLIDPRKNEVVWTIAVGPRPATAAFFDPASDGADIPALYVVQQTTDAMQVLRGPTTPTPTDFFAFTAGASVGVGRRPEGIGVKPDGTEVWVANRGEHSLSIIDRATDGVIATVPLGPVGAQPVAVGFSPDGRLAYVLGRSSNNLIVLDAESAAADPAGAIVASVEVGRSPVALAVDPLGGVVYVANRADGLVAVVDVSMPQQPALLARVRAGEKPQAMALLPDGGKLYVTNNGSDTVSVYQIEPGPPFLSLLVTIPVGQTPSGIALVAPYAYVANRASNTLSVIDTTIDRTIATIAVGVGPTGVAAGGLSAPR